MTWAWIATFLVASIIMTYLVPRERLMRFLTFGIWAGAGIGILLLYTMVNILEAWSFTGDFLTIAGVPLALAVTWAPLQIIYAHYFPGKNEFWHFFIYIGSLPVASTLFHYGLIQVGLLQYSGWGLTYTLLVSLLIQGSLAYYLYKYQYNYSINSSS